MKHAGPRRIRLRTVVTYPAVTVALVVSVALAFASFGPSQAIALTAVPAPTETATATPSTTPAPAPSTTPAPAPSTTPVPAPSTTPVPAPLPSPSATTVAAPGVVTVDHGVLARIEGPPFQAEYLPIDEFVIDAAQFQTIRVRFQVRNASAAPITLTPQLEYRTDARGSYTVVPEKPMKGIPFQAASEWVASPGLSGGTMQSPLGEDIPVADLRTGKPDGLAMVGHRSMGANPDQKITLPSASYTEQEFTIRLTMDAAYLTGYQFRITNGGTVLAGTNTATILLGAAPVAVLSPGQHQGVAVPGPKDPAKPTSGTGTVK